MSEGRLFFGTVLFWFSTSLVVLHLHGTDQFARLGSAFVCLAIFSAIVSKGSQDRQVLLTIQYLFSFADFAGKYTKSVEVQLEYLRDEARHITANFLAPLASTKIPEKLAIKDTSELLSDIPTIEKQMRDALDAGTVLEKKVADLKAFEASFLRKYQHMYISEAFLGIVGTLQWGFGDLIANTAG